MMIRYEYLCQKPDDMFKRLSGVARPVFDTMVSIVAQTKKAGRPHSLSFEDQVLLTLEYLRTYKTQLGLWHQWKQHQSHHYQSRKCSYQIKAV